MLNRHIFHTTGGLILHCNRYLQYASVKRVYTQLFHEEYFLIHVYVTHFFFYASTYPQKHLKLVEVSISTNAWEGCRRSPLSNKPKNIKLVTQKLDKSNTHVDEYEFPCATSSWEALDLRPSDPHLQLARFWYRLIPIPKPPWAMNHELKPFSKIKREFEATLKCL